jgi:hypothetical protein
VVSRAAGFHDDQADTAVDEPALELASLIQADQLRQALHLIWRWCQYRFEKRHLWGLLWELP